MALGHMNVEIGTEAAQFPEKRYINAIFLAVHIPTPLSATPGSGEGESRSEVGLFSPSVPNVRDLHSRGRRSQEPETPPPPALKPSLGKFQHYIKLQYTYTVLYTLSRKL
jgi:hypothetical protein